MADDILEFDAGRDMLWNVVAQANVWLHSIQGLMIFLLSKDWRKIVVISADENRKKHPIL